MIKLIYGPKGFGKTKIIMDDVDAAAKQAKGNVVFITDKKICSVSIDLNVRCVYTEEYGINSAGSRFKLAHPVFRVQSFKRGAVFTTFISAPNIVTVRFCFN